jgi:uncharacterized protein involved in outer membrane biogenesis
MSRLFLIPLVLILLLVLGTAVLIPLLLDKDKVLEFAITTLHEKTGALLTVNGDTALTLFPTLGVSLSDAAITLPEKQQSDLRVRSLDIGLQLLPLFSGNIAIDTLKLDGLVVRIASLEESATDDADQPDITSAAGTALAVPLALNVKHLLITDSRLEQIDSATTSTIIEVVKLQAHNLNLEQKPVPVELVLKRPGDPVMELNLVGSLRFDQQTQQINLDKVTTVISGATAESLKLQTSGRIDLSHQVADLQLALELGDAHGKGTLRYAALESPRIEANLQFNLFSPALLALAGPQASVATEDSSTTANGGDPLPLDTLRLIDTHAVLDIEQAHFDAHTVNNLHVDLRALNGLIQVSALTGILHGGKLEASATFDGTADTAALETSGNLGRLDIATALAAAESEPVLTGTASLRWQLSGHGRTTNELTAALNGPVSVTTENVVLQGTSVEKLLCQAVALTNQESLTASFPEDTRFDAFSADIQIAGGKARLNPLQAALPYITLTGDGHIDLLERDFDATFKARLSPQMEELDHACRVSKRLTAIDWPIDCSGEFSSKPAKWCRVDSSKILQDLTINEGKEKLKKKANKLFNKLFN